MVIEYRTLSVLPVKFCRYERDGGHFVGVIFTENFGPFYANESFDFLEIDLEEGTISAWNHPPINGTNNKSCKIESFQVLK